MAWFLIRGTAPAEPSPWSEQSRCQNQRVLHRARRDSLVAGPARKEVPNGSDANPKIHSWRVLTEVVTFTENGQLVSCASR